MLYDKNRGPKTIPPAIPVIPHRILAIQQKMASLITWPAVLSLTSLLSNLYPSFSLIVCIKLTYLILMCVIRPVTTVKMENTIHLLFEPRVELLPQSICAMYRDPKLMRVKRLLLHVK
jgi:hypothetical protein